MATKRLSGWVEVFEDGSLGVVCPTRKEALIGMAGARRVVERLPGDVVLGKWQLDEAERLRGIGRGEDALDLILSLRGRR